MENDPGDHLQQALIREINGLLEYEGMVLPDREIIIPPQDVAELDTVDIVIGRNDRYRRTVCHIHQPPNEEYYWRHETFVAWDDGRTARYRVDIALSESEERIMQTLRDSGFAFFGELERLKSQYVLDEPSAEAIEDSVFNELKRIKTDVEDTLLAYEEMQGESNDAVVRQIIGRIEAHVPLGMAPRPELDELYRVIHALRHAQYEMIALRERLSERYLALSDHSMQMAESDPMSVAPAAETWNLLQLLDRIHET